MNNPNYDKTITEGELCKLLNIQGKALGVWESPTPNEVIRDNFDLVMVNDVITTNDYCMNQEEVIRITNTNLIYHSSLLTNDIPITNNPTMTYLDSINTQQTKKILINYLETNMRRVFICIGFVKAVYRLIVNKKSTSFSLNVGNRIKQLRQLIEYAINNNLTETFSNIINTSWEDISMMYFVHINKGIPVEEYDFDVYQKYYEVENIMIDYILDQEFHDLLERPDSDKFVEIKAMMLQWRREHSDGSKGEEMKL